MDLVGFAVMMGAAFACILGFAVTIATLVKHVPSGQAMIVTTPQPQPRVVFTSAVVMPIIHRAEFIDLTVKTLTVERRGEDALRCADGLRAELTVSFHLHVHRTVEDVIRVAQSVGAARAADPGALAQLFEARFTEALKAVAARLRFSEISDDREGFQRRVLEVIGADLGGYRLEDAVLVSLRRAA